MQTLLTFYLLYIVRQVIVKIIPILMILVQVMYYRCFFKIEHITNTRVLQTDMLYRYINTYSEVDSELYQFYFATYFLKLQIF